jgi:hypothetical protein
MRSRAGACRRRTVSRGRPRDGDGLRGPGLLGAQQARRGVRATIRFESREEHGAVRDGERSDTSGGSRWRASFAGPRSPTSTARVRR